VVATADGGDFLDLPCRHATVLLGGVRQEVDRCGSCRCRGGHGQRSDLLGGCHTEFHHIVHAIGTEDGLHRQLTAVGIDHHGTVGVFEQGIVRQAGTRLADEESVAGAKYLVFLVIGDNGEDGLTGFLRPFGCLCRSPLGQQYENE